jgi:hypothetical protein
LQPVQQPMWPTYIQAGAAFINVVIVLISTATNFTLIGLKHRDTRNSRIKVATVLALRLRQIAENLQKVRSNGVNEFLEMSLTKGVPEESILKLFDPDLVSEIYILWDYLVELQRNLVVYKNKEDWDIPADVLNDVNDVAQSSLELGKRLVNIK